MKILFLLSGQELATAETYCHSLAKVWRGRHEIFWIADRLNLGQVYTSMPIAWTTFPLPLVNAARVARFIRRQQIQVVHSQSRSADKVATQAARWSGIAHVTTQHHPLSERASARVAASLGAAAIAIDETVQECLLKDYGVPAGRVHLIRNGIVLTEFSPSLRDTPGQKKILLIGRLTGNRWDAFQFFLKTLESGGLPPALYQVVGRVPLDRQYKLVHQLSVLNSRITPARVEMLGFVNDLGITVRNADGVVASGRSAMEALANARPAVILGAGGTLGFCSPAVWPLAMRTNFGDHLSPPHFDAGKLKTGLLEIIAQRGVRAEHIRWGRAQMETHYDAVKVAAQIEHVYRSVVHA